MLIGSLERRESGVKLSWEGMGAADVTSKPRGAGVIRDHLDRLLHHTQLKAIQWINLNRHVVEFTTLSRRGTDRIMTGQNHKSDVIRDQFCTARKTMFSA